ncbi:Uncharacterised protein [Streptococcus pneumoniae]|nr:Uncharacterised protein [Streptococcus pneumoniae]COG12752.1 Uncharacterised protein [Streptococcus pneumoniae]COG84123.1 Uncharacterised protein [Streptococcus pneumoniae]
MVIGQDENSYGWSYVKTVDGTSTYTERKN